MLTTETVTIGDAVDELTEQIETLEEALEDLDDDTDQAETVRGRRSRLSYFRNGLEWELSEGDWTDETTMEVGALTAGEEAMMHREAPDHAEPEEMRLWFVAASVETAPFVEDGLDETFANVAALHPGAVEWIEAKANSLGIAGDSGNPSGASSPATENEATSTPGPDSTT